MTEVFPVLTIAGSDSCGGAGVQTDIRTMWQLGCYPTCVITAVTAQNTTGVVDFQAISAELVDAQIDAVLTDIPILAMKSGMLANKDIVNVVAEKFSKKNISYVLDPVMIATSGDALIKEDAINLIIKKLFPIATLVTPNIQEAQVLTGTEDIDNQVKRLRELGCTNILLKGGDSEDKECKTDYLAIEGKPIQPLQHPGVNTRNTHGTGCTLSAAITAFLARGNDMEQAVKMGIDFVHQSLERGKSLTLGHGHGPCLLK